MVTVASTGLEQAKGGSSHWRLDRKLVERPSDRTCDFQSRTQPSWCDSPREGSRGTNSPNSLSRLPPVSCQRSTRSKTQPGATGKDCWCGPYNTCLLGQRTGWRRQSMDLEGQREAVQHRACPHRAHILVEEDKQHSNSKHSVNADHVPDVLSTLQCYNSLTPHNS